MIRAAAVTYCACAVVVAGCGGGDQARSTSSSTDTAMKPRKSEALKGRDATTVGKRTTVKVVTSQYGHIVADGRGQAFYVFGKESSKRSQCYGECANKWPPVPTNGNPSTGRGSDSRLLGTTRRRDGKLQLTYAGHPLYYYQDDGPDRVLCQGVNEFGGVWLVVRPDGHAAR